MLKASHIIVADKILQDVQCQMNWRVNRTAYLFGSIAPDLNCIYPAHSITATIKRFRKKLNRVNKSESTIIKSFTLGVIMHYICDYFCYAHNRRMPDPKHSIYERLLKKHIKNHEEQLGEVPDSLIDQWNEIKIHVTEEFSQDSNQDVDEIIKNICSNSSDHINYILDIVAAMHDTYMAETNSIKDNVWYKSTAKISLDMEYTTFMCEKIAMLLFNPNGELKAVA